jgi:hypothetical protein
MKRLATWVLIMLLGAVAFGCRHADSDSGTDADTDIDSDTDTDTDTNTDTDTDSDTIECNDYDGPTHYSCDEVGLGECCQQFECYKGVVHGEWHLHWYGGVGCWNHGLEIGMTCDYTCPGECSYEGPFVDDELYPENGAELVEYFCALLDGGPGDASPDADVAE